MIASLGVGIGWRPELALAIERRKDLGFIEVTAENLRLDKLPRALMQIVERGTPVIVHGLSLSLGGAEPPDLERVELLCKTAERLGARLISEHLAFVRADGTESGHLLPVPRTREALEVIVANVIWAKAQLGFPLALENIAALVDWPDEELDEASFLREVVRRTGSDLLFDVSNLYANACNGGWDPVAALERLPLDRLAYVHVAGGTVRDGLYHDTHSHPVPSGPLRLLEELCARVEPPGVMLERDDDFPPDVELWTELDSIHDAIRRGTARRMTAQASDVR
ncbi:MAG: DUF692 domain-containing protein [Candidatus Dormibacteria bacterium]